MSKIWTATMRKPGYPHMALMLVIAATAEEATETLHRLYGSHLIISEMVEILVGRVAYQIGGDLVAMPVNTMGTGTG